MTSVACFINIRCQLNRTKFNNPGTNCQSLTFGPIGHISLQFDLELISDKKLSYREKTCWQNRRLGVKKNLKTIDSFFVFDNFVFNIFLQFF